MAERHRAVTRFVEHPMLNRHRSGHVLDRLYHTDIGSGRPVVILHGGKLDHRHMLDAVEPVFQSVTAWRRIYIDLPGCGASVGFDDVITEDDVLDRVLELLRSLVPDQPVAVIGEPRGSYIAQGLAYAEPTEIAGLCLIVPGGFPSDPPPQIPDARPLVADPALLENLPPPIRARAERLVVQTGDIIDKIRQFKIPAADLHDAGLEDRLQRHFLFSFHDEMLASEFAKPSLILSGRQDSISGYADTVSMLNCYPRATFGLLDTAGHSLSWERPDLFKAMMHDWLKRLEQT